MRYTLPGVYGTVQKVSIRIVLDSQLVLEKHVGQSRYRNVQLRRGNTDAREAICVTSCYIYVLLHQHIARGELMLSFL